MSDHPIEAVNSRLGPQALVREPLSWRSRLGVTRWARYTEVDDQPVIVNTQSAHTIVLSRATARLLVNFDGRPLGEILNIEMNRCDETTKEQTIHTLRVCKALGVIEDVDAAVTPAPDDCFAVFATAKRVDVLGTLEPYSATNHDEKVCLTLRFLSPEMLANKRSNSSISKVVLSLSNSGTPVTAIVPALHASVLGRQPTRLETFDTLVHAVEPRDQLADEGVADLLAAIADHFASTGTNGPRVVAKPSAAPLTAPLAEPPSTPPEAQGG